MQNFFSMVTFAGWNVLAVCHAHARPEATISFQLQNGRPIVNATVNHVPLPLLLDLGGYDTIVLSKTDAEKTGAHANNSTQTFSSFDGKVGSSFGVRFNMVTVGDASFGGVDGSALGGEGNSYLGAGLLGKKLIVLDYARNQVRLYKSGDSHALQRECGTKRFPVDVRRGVFQTYLRTEGKTLTAAFDTGANYSVIRPSVLNLKVAEYVPGSSPEIHKLLDMRLNETRVGEMNAVLIEFKGPPVDVILGTNFFHGRRVCLDGPAHIGAMR